MTVTALEPELGVSILSPLASLWIQLVEGGVLRKKDDRPPDQPVPSELRCAKCYRPYTCYRVVGISGEAIRLRCRYDGALRTVEVMKEAA